MVRTTQLNFPVRIQQLIILCISLLVRCILGLNDVSPKILDIDTHTGMQPGSLIAATELYLEYRSDGNDDGFEATVTAQASRKFLVKNVLKTTTPAQIKISKILETLTPF